MNLKIALIYVFIKILNVSCATQLHVQHFTLSATKQVGSGEILIWDLTKHVQKEIKEVLIEPMIKLKYPQTSVKYLNLGFSNGQLINQFHQYTSLEYNTFFLGLTSQSKIYFHGLSSDN